MGRYDFPPDVRQRIKERDGGCIFCQMFGSSGYPPTQIMHFIPRSHQGLGVEQNGALGCVYHHQELDNGINSEPYKRVFREYLESQYEDFDVSKLMYNKWEVFE